jgi:hypothetical protein
MGMEILFSFGSLRVYTMSLFLVIAFFWSGMVIAKKAVEYHLGETEVFDAITLALLGVGVLIKILGYLNLSNYGFLALFLAVTGASWFLAKRSDEKLMTILDVMALGVPMVFVWWNLGLFWARDFAGLPMSGEWGVVSEQLRVWPVELARAFLSLLAFLWLWKLEGEYRCFGWYRGRRSAANTGFIVGAMLVFWGVIEVIGGFMSVNTGQWFFYERGIMIILGMAVIYWRSERNLRVDLGSILSRFKKTNSVN